VPWLLLQTVGHAPQCSGSLVRLVSQPLTAFASQLPDPALHVMPHTPAVHVAVPLVELHTFVQLPQKSGSVLMLVSHPFVTSASQFRNPAEQLIVQTPLAHDGVPLTLLQTWPHPPQLFTSALRLVSQPGEAVQSP
jgi:hypothetical protein